jgi:hypothetical protein
MTALSVVRSRAVLLLDTSLEPRVYSQDRLWVPGRLMGDSPDTPPGITLLISGVPPASTGTRDRS